MLKMSHAAIVTVQCAAAVVHECCLTNANALMDRVLCENIKMRKIPHVCWRTRHYEEIMCGKGCHLLAKFNFSADTRKAGYIGHPVNQAAPRNYKTPDSRTDVVGIL